MRKKIITIFSLLSIMLFSLVVSSPLSYAETLSEDMTLETELLGPNPEEDPTFIIVIERELEHYPMPHGANGDIFEIELTGAQNINFPDIDYQEIGDYAYLIYQKDLDDESYRIDGTTYRLHVIVTLDEDHEGLIVSSNISKLGEDLKTDNIRFINEYVQDVLGDKIPKPISEKPSPDPLPAPKGVKGASFLPLTGSVDVYYMIGLISILLGLLIKTHMKIREKTSS